MRVIHLRDRIDPIIERGIKELSMTLGALAHIENNHYELVAVKSNSGVYVPGDKFALGDTFCREVFEQQKIIAITKIDNPSLSLNHPLYHALPLECYIGAPVLLNDKAWGCLDFSSMAQCEREFNQQEIELVESLAGEISDLIGSQE